MRRIAVLPLLAALAWPAAVRAAEEREGTSKVDLPAGTAQLADAELHAGAVGEQIRVDVDLSTDPGDAALRVGLPPDVDDVGGPPRLADSASGRVGLEDAGRSVTLDLDRARAGDQATLAIEDRGLPAGTYTLPVRWVKADGSATPAGALTLRIHAGEREERGPDWNRVGEVRIESNASNDASEESETFIVGGPHDANRLVAAGNKGGDLSGGFFLSGDGARSWSERHVSTQMAVPGGGGVQSARVSGDPILAADDRGNIWAGGLTVCRSTTVVSRIYVDRMPAGSDTFRSPSVGLPILHGAGTCDGDTVQDKPQMTIDNFPSSPTYGRLYVTWDDPDPAGGVNVVVSFCDTRPDASHCDDPNSWSAPARVSGPDDGSFISSDPAVGPDGRVYVVWWDYSAAGSSTQGNAIKIASCAASCSASGNWTSPAAVAQLTDPFIPFACPTPAQPGGRVGEVPSIAVTANGRLYVSWSDLRPGSDAGSGLRCPQSGAQFAQAANAQTWDSFVATASSLADLLAAGDRSSTSVGARVVRDGGSSSTDNSDEWFPWVAVDRASAQAYVDFYSSSGDSTRRTALFYLAAIAPGGGTQADIGPVQQVATSRSDYSANPCCNFGNDYGDYTGLTVAAGSVYPTWTFRSGLGDDGEVKVGIPGPSLAVDAAQLVETGGDGDGVAEAGEPFRIDLRLRNDGAGNAAGIRGTLSAPGGEAAVDGTPAAFGDASRRGGTSGTAGITGQFGTACGTQATLRLDVTADDDAQSLPVSVPVACQPPQAQPVLLPTLAPPPLLPSTVAPRSPGGKATMRRARLSTVLKRGVAVRVSCVRTCTMRLKLLLPPAKGKRGPTVTLASLTVTKLKRARTVRLRLGRTARGRLRSSHRKRLQLQFVATTAAAGRQARTVTVVLR